jgi:hypothetical protein
MRSSVKNEKLRSLFSTNMFCPYELDNNQYRKNSKAYLMMDEGYFDVCKKTNWTLQC